MGIGFVERMKGMDNAEEEGREEEEEEEEVVVVFTATETKVEEEKATKWIDNYRVHNNNIINNNSIINNNGFLITNSRNKLIDSQGLNTGLLTTFINSTTKRMKLWILWKPKLTYRPTNLSRLNLLRSNSSFRLVEPRIRRWI